MPTSTPFIEWLGRAEGDVRSLGGKGASLDRLIRWGFRVPPGFCMTTAAFERQLAALPEAEALIARLPDPDARDGLEAAMAKADLVPELAAELERSTSALANEANAAAAFAVRSSAVGEDSAGASYAGLHETELGLGAAEVSAAVRRCWASLWSGPAMFYRTRRSLPLDGGAMAVVVQQLVPADAAAVLFTRHPVTGRTDQIVITAVRGLGDEMVSGTVTPDTFVLDRATLAIVERELADGPTEPAVDDRRLRELATLALQAESAYGTAVDIEAAIGDGEWYLLQARPITT